MRLVQSKAAVALARSGRSQKGCGIRKLAFALSLACLFAPASAPAQNAYITNRNQNASNGTVTVIDTATNTVVGSPITVGIEPTGVAVSPDGSKVYITNTGPADFGPSNPPGSTVSVIDTATNTVVGSPITVGQSPQGVAVSPDGSHVYVAIPNPSQSGIGFGTVSVIDTATNTVFPITMPGTVRLAWRSPPTAAKSMSPVPDPA
jgi:YVTN family beta-propeller protein